MTNSKRPLPRTFIIIVFGPLVGAIVMTITLFALSMSTWEDPNWQGVAIGLMLFLSFGYMAGFMPAAASAFLWRLVPRAWPLSRRALAAIAIGASTNAIFVWPFMFLFVAFLPPNWIFAAMAAVCGAISLCATALPERRR